MLAALHLVVVYFGTAGLGLWLVHRFVRPLSATAALWLALLPLALPGAALVRGQVYAPMDLLYLHAPWSDVAEAQGVEPQSSIAGDLPFQIVPWHLAVRDAWAAGDWPLWNPYMLSGDLLAASAQPAPYHPINLLSLLLPLDLSLTFQAAAMLLLAAAGGFVFCRELECGELASLVGAAAWMLSGFLVFWLLWPMHSAVATLPWIVAGVHRLPRFGLLATGLTLLLLSGHPESMLHVVATGCIYGLFVLVQRFRRLGVTPRARFRGAARIVAAAVLAGGIAGSLGAIHLLPIVDALPETAMYELRRTLFAEQDHSVPWIVARERVTTAVLPFRFGISWTEEKLPASGFFIPMSSAYVGTVALGLALFGLWTGRRKALTWFLATWAVVGVLAGAGAPGVTHAMSALPFFDLSIHRRWVFAAAWALATLAALGVDALLRRGGKAARADLLRLAACLAASSAVAAVALWENWAEMRAPTDGGTGPGDGLSVDFLVHHGLLLILVPVAAVACVFAARRFPRISLRHVGWLLLWLVVGQRAVESAGRFPSLDRDDAFPEVPILSAIPPAETPERVVGIGFTFLANTSAFYGLEDVRGYQPMSSRIYTQTFSLWDTQPNVFFNQVSDLRSPFLDFLGVRWAIAPRNVSGGDGWQRVDVSRSVQLMKNADALPRAFLPTRVVLEQGGAFSRMRNVKDFSHIAFIDTPKPNVAAATPFANGRGRVTTTRRGTGLRLELDLQDEAWVVISEPHWRGWRAVRRGADGQRTELPVHTANLAFLALHLPAGESEVELFFSPTSFRVGRAITLGMLGMLGVLVTASLWRRRIRIET